jgi:hypothetical protein
MRKDTQHWTVADLSARLSKIDFPEYQREPTVWSRRAKQRLVDSILRQFDIASLYLYDTGDGSFDCIDGRQRIGAIMSFLGKNQNDHEDNGFELKSLNEIYVDDVLPFGTLEGKSLKEIETLAAKNHRLAKLLVSSFTEYRLTIVMLSKSKRPEEFNLQFTRLNLGTIINSGEKLHAMVGDMRDMCFGAGGLGQHSFFEGVKVPTRRFSKEQIAAQILAQLFAIQLTREFARTRHFDLQKFFKDNTALDAKRRAWVDELKNTLNLLAEAFKGSNPLKNRAITVSAVLLAWKLKINSKKAAATFAEFVTEFLCRLNWQLGKGLDVDDEYRYLIEFQRDVTQASVEKPAVKARAERLETEFNSWNTRQELTGDAAYRVRTNKYAAKECRK